MTKAQFIKAAKSLGFSDEIIEKTIKLHEEAATDGLKIPWGVDLEALPVSEWLIKYSDHFQEEFPILMVRNLSLILSILDQAEHECCLEKSDFVRINILYC